jgi:dimethylargininase
MSTYGRYSHAIVCRIPDSFSKALGTSEVINVEEARKELEEYTKVLRSLGLDVIELPADENFPDCPFIEDTALIINGIVY